MPIAKNLLHQGYIVHIAALHPNFKSLEEKEIISSGVPVEYVSQMHIKKMGNSTQYYKGVNLLIVSFIATIKLFLYTINNPANVIIIGKPHPMNTIAGILASLFVKAKTVLDCDDYEAASNFFSSPWQRKVIQCFEDLAPKLVGQITTNTLFTKERIIRLGVNSDKIHYLPNGIDEERFNKVESKKTQILRKTLGLDDLLTIVYIGSLNLDNHPVDLLLRAFQLVNREIPKTRLIIVGGGKDFNNLKHLSIRLSIDKVTHFIGRVSPEKVPEYYSIANVTVDPVNDNDSAKGRCPLKMFESWAMNVPFVSSSVGDREVLSGSPAAALLGDPGNVEDLAQNLLQLLIDPKLRSFLIKNGKKKVQNYLWKEIVLNNHEYFIQPNLPLNNRDNIN